MKDISQRIRELLSVLNAHWPAFAETELEYTPGPGKWSKKEILGHLIDSAVNNHRRFVLSQILPEPLVIVPYDQDQWVLLSRYQYTPAAELLQLWTLYNTQLARMLEHIPDSAASFRCEFDNGYTVSLRWLAEDYVVHMEQHIHQILNISVT